MSETVRLTVGQATIRFLVNQFVEADGETKRLIAGAFGIFGHGNVAGIGQALLQNELDPGPDGGEMPYIMPRNEQGMVNAAAAFAKATNRQQTYMCTASIGPGSLNMVTGAALATTNTTTSTQRPVAGAQVCNAHNEPLVSPSATRNAASPPRWSRHSRSRPDTLNVNARLAAVLAIAVATRVIRLAA